MITSICEMCKEPRNITRVRSSQNLCRKCSGLLRRKPDNLCTCCGVKRAKTSKVGKCIDCYNAERRKNLSDKGYKRVCSGCGDIKIVTTLANTNSQCGSCAAKKRVAKVGMPTPNKVTKPKNRVTKPKDKKMAPKAKVLKKKTVSQEAIKKARAINKYHREMVIKETKVVKEQSMSDDSMIQEFLKHNKVTVIPNIPCEGVITNCSSSLGSRADINF